MVADPIHREDSGEPRQPREPRDSRTAPPLPCHPLCQIVSLASVPAPRGQELGDLAAAHNQQVNEGAQYSGKKPNILVMRATTSGSARSVGRSIDVRNPNPYAVIGYDLPVTSRLRRSPTARQNGFGPDRAASRWPECGALCRPTSGGGGIDQPAAIHVFSVFDESWQRCRYQRRQWRQRLRLWKVTPCQP